MPPVAIARQFKTTPRAISTALCRLRGQGFDVPAFTTVQRAPTTKIAVGRDALKELAAPAKRAGLTTRAVAESLIRWAAANGHIAAALQADRGL